MGVAVLMLNDALTVKELELIKSEITRQAAEGFGETFEQKAIQSNQENLFSITIKGCNATLAL